ncbi:transposase [Candidatus Sumerlaeota bacterium]|nr:transposase [Candidatus Sumerlaeota bacterium]
MEVRASHWHHSPIHLFIPDATYMVTAGTLEKAHYSRDARLRHLCDQLHEVARTHGWHLHAWAVFSNHYHWIGHTESDPKSLIRLISHVHTVTAKWVNQQDRCPGRKVWFQYWDKCLTYENSYYARLNYVNQNPVNHGIVPVAELYPYGSAQWFATKADPTYRRKVASYKFDQLRIEDDF